MKGAARGREEEAGPRPSGFSDSLGRLRTWPLILD